ncbi:MAG: cobalt-precorrin-5B (C(1))-methyltransferase [Propionibacterium freudenreichii]
MSAGQPDATGSDASQPHTHGRDSGASPAPAGQPPRHVTSSDAPAGPGNDARLAREGRRAQTSGREAQLTSSGLRPGWTTGACAAAAARAAWSALHTGNFPDPVEVELPAGRRPAFALTFEQLGDDTAMAAITKDAGDDPDVTDGAVIRATVERGRPGSGITLRAGSGVGTVTRPGLPLSVGEPAINPVPRTYIAENLAAADRSVGGNGSPDVVLTLSIDDGEQIAQRTWNPKIGILGGLSVLGTTGVVVPYSCSAWIASIHEGIDVARADGASHAAACTGSTSQRIARELYPDVELLDMGDFAGAVLKYLHSHPLPRLTICGGFAKMSKLANGYLDLHSHRTRVDQEQLARLAREGGGDDELVAAVGAAHTASQAYQLSHDAGIELGDLVARAAARQAAITVDAPIDIEVICTDRAGTIIGRSPFTAAAH